MYYFIVSNLLQQLTSLRIRKECQGYYFKTHFNYCLISFLFLTCTHSLHISIISPLIKYTNRYYPLFLDV